jgi:hypothetical protein
METYGDHEINQEMMPAAKNRNKDLHGMRQVCKRFELRRFGQHPLKVAFPCYVSLPPCIYSIDELSGGRENILRTNCVAYTNLITSRYHQQQQQQQNNNKGLRITLH